jgi:hypothetical protein
VLVNDFLQSAGMFYCLQKSRSGKNVASTRETDARREYSEAERFVDHVKARKIETTRSVVAITDQLRTCGSSTVHTLVIINVRLSNITKRAQALGRAHIVYEFVSYENVRILVVRIDCAH